MITCQFSDKTRISIKNNSRLHDSLQFYSGDSISLRIQVNDEFEQPLDITGYLIKFGIKPEEYFDEYTYYLQSDQNTEINVLNAKKGLFDINIPYQETEKWDIGYALFFSIELTSPENIRKTILKSRIEMLPDI